MDKSLGVGIRAAYFYVSLCEYDSIINGAAALATKIRFLPVFHAKAALRLFCAFYTNLFLY